MSFVLGIDIGGTKTSAGIFDSNINAVGETTFPTMPQDGAENLLDRIYEGSGEILKSAGMSWDDVSAVGIASPGPLDIPNGKVVSAPTMGWYDVPITALAERRFGKKVLLENDTNAAAIWEYQSRGGTFNPLAYITVSTGIGCGIVIDGKVLSGRYSAAGEIGHVNVAKDGRPCGCGNRGCLELYASGTSIGALYSEAVQNTVSAMEVFKLARAGDEKAVEIVKHAGGHLGYAVSLLCQIIDPSVIVFGGSVTKDFDMLYPVINETANRLTEPYPGREIRIEKSEFDGKQVILGAAGLAAEASRAWNY